MVGGWEKRLLVQCYLLKLKDPKGKQKTHHESECFSTRKDSESVGALFKILMNSKKYVTNVNVTSFGNHLQIQKKQLLSYVFIFCSWPRELTVFFVDVK